MSNVVYDKVSWHFPEGKNCPSLSDAKKHFEIIMGWARDKKLLSSEGVELLEIGVDSDFSISSSMLNKEGDLFFKKKYSEFIGEIKYGEEKDYILSKLNRLYSTL